MNERNAKIVILHNGVPKEVTVSEEVAQMLNKAYDESKCYGLGGSTAKKLKDFYKKQLAEFERLKADEANKGRSATMLFAEAFHIYSNEAPLLLMAMEWVEKQKGKEGFSSRQITLDNFLNEDVFEGRLPVQYNPYVLLVEDFAAWAGKSLVNAQLSVSFVRFVKFFYAVIK